MTTQKLPQILDVNTVASSTLFEIEQLDLRFSNGELRQYERMKPTGRHGVMTVPISSDNHILLVKEYAAGTERYELGFPKGLIDHGEKAIDAANRELKEEIGFGARKLTVLKNVVLAPSYFSSEMTIFLAQELYEEVLEGDEPEPLEIIRWPLCEADKLLTSIDFQEARSICALLLTMRFLDQSGK